MRYLGIISIVILLLTAVLMPATARAELQAPEPESLEKVLAALPDKPTAEPKASRKVLVFNLCTGFAHSSIPIAAHTMKMMGEKSEAFEAGNERLCTLLYIIDYTAYLSKNK